MKLGWFLVMVNSFIINYSFESFEEIFSVEQEMISAESVAVIDLTSYKIHFLHRFIIGREQCHRQTLWNGWVSL
jgi:hypothetical protein